MITITRLTAGVAAALLALAASSAIAKPGGGHGGGGHGRGSHGASMGNHGNHGQGMGESNRASQSRNDDENDQDGDGGPPFAKFKGLDTNRDGVLSSSEAAANTDVSTDFKTFDRDGNGTLSKREYARFKNKMARNNPARDDEELP